MNRNSFFVFLLFLGVTAAAAAFGATFTPGLWYDALQKPSWNPPNWVFGPVWSALYLAMAVAAWLVWRERKTPPDVRPALAMWGAQLALNAAWSWLFFGLHEMAWAFAEILALWAAIFVTVILFRRHSKLAALLLVPYLAWVSFAAFLNYTLWQLN